MLTGYDSRTPAPGVRVMPAPGPKIHLSLSQAKAARKIPMNSKGDYTGRGVIRQKPLGGALGLDIHSTVMSCPKMLCPTRGPSSGRRPRSPKPGPRNPCFAMPMPTAHHLDKQVGVHEIKNLKKMHARLSGFGRPLNNWKGFSESYSQRRVQFAARHPGLLSELARIETEHNI